MFETHSSICTAAFFSEGDEAWAVHYTEIDKECGRKRFWYSASPEQQKQLDEFLQEHSRVAAERDQWKQESGVYASEVDRLESETRKLEWQCKDYENRMNAAGQGASAVDVSKLLPKLPSNLLQVAEAASRFFPRLIITEDALESAKEYHDCKIEIHRACQEWHEGETKPLRTEEWRKRFESLDSVLSSAGLNGEVFIWDDFHDRFLVSDIIGILMGNGFDVSKDPNEKTTWARIGRDDRAKIQREFAHPNSPNHELRGQFVIGHEQP